MKFTLSTAILTGFATLASAQSPQMPGLAPNCNRYHYVQSGDTCAVIAAANGISVAQFLSWNSEVNAGCTNLWLNYFVCTGVSSSGGTTTATVTSTADNGGTTTTNTVTSTNDNGGTTTTATVTSTAGNGGTTTTSGGPTSTPTNTSPQMPGLPSTCWLFHTVETGDTCEIIAASYGVTLAQFYAWNPEINSTCTNLWLGFAVCVGA
ncbi:hypothetical protein QC763_401460 [Podospora pseudopauciseta]|uniref:LysM domain-containing protein n=2 Tax=Podospora TaxID=5144 RepID=A0ABR0HBF5_9PEZI|nr:hypothetical protein QC763_401460 [Podospora pseudopauciseta]KAK4676553.1 hypothetical protein QC764_401460 [Podospora pseudoanserina]